jgi:hypothetical protein
MRIPLRALILFAATLSPAQEWPGLSRSYFLPNGWKLTPVRNTSIPTTRLACRSRRARRGVLHSGYNPHGVVVISTETGGLSSAFR